MQYWWAWLKRQSLSEATSAAVSLVQTSWSDRMLGLVKGSGLKKRILICIDSPAFLSTCKISTLTWFRKDHRYRVSSLHVISGIHTPHLLKPRVIRTTSWLLDPLGLVVFPNSHICLHKFTLVKKNDVLFYKSNQDHCDNLTKGRTSIESRNTELKKREIRMRKRVL